MSRRSSSSTPVLINALRRSRRPRWLIMIAVVLFLAYKNSSQPDNGDGDVRPIDTAVSDQEYVVQRVVDGDTLLMEGGDRVRLLGVDTPETVRENFPVEPWGPEASSFTKQMVEGRAVVLKFAKERRDRYGRILAYVYVDGVHLNEELIRAGFSEAQLQYSYSDAMKRTFREAEEEARAAKRGIWSDEAPDSSTRNDPKTAPVR